MMIHLKSACLIPLTQKGKARSGAENVVASKNKNKKHFSNSMMKRPLIDDVHLHFETVTAIGQILSELCFSCWPMVGTTRGVRG